MLDRTAAKDAPVSVEALEEEFQIRLPADYAQFLADPPQGLSQKTFRIPPGGGSTLRELFSTTPQLREAASRSKGWLPAGILHVGYDIGDNWICLDLRKGRVFWMDHEALEMQPLANSLSDFIKELAVPVGFVSEDAVELVGTSGSRNDALALIAQMGPALKNSSGRSLAQEASRHGNIEVLSLCHELRHDLRGCLHLAAMNDKLEMVKHLVEQCQMDINESNERGFTPLQFVMFDQSLKNWMVRKGAK